MNEAPMHSINPDPKKQKKRGRSISFNVASVFLALVIFSGLFASSLAPFSFEFQNLDERLLGPSLQHLMGTDSLGRDLFSRILFGARISLFIGLATASISLVIGTFIGAVSGFRGGAFDIVTTRIVEFFYAIPSLLLAILIGLMFKNSVSTLVLSISVTAWMTHARLVRGLVIQTKNLPFVEAATATGASQTRIFFKHILPQLWPAILVSLGFQVPSSIMAESFLSFVGLGISPPMASWGSLASDGFRAIQSYPYLAIFPCSMLFLTLVSLQFVAERVRERAELSQPARFD